jgi:hypothetical protein
MRIADLIFYPAEDSPTRFVRLDCDKCLRLLLPYLQGCRESGRISSAVAEIDFPDGGVVWFAAEEGTLDVHRERPRFGRSRKWCGIFPAPMHRHSQHRVADDTIQQVVRSVYDRVAA